LKCFPFSFVNPSIKNGGKKEALAGEEKKRARKIFLENCGFPHLDLI
jgi:hypothetical protein